MQSHSSYDNEIFENCYSDRFRTLSQIKYGIFKKYGLDLIIKELFLFINSWGTETKITSGANIFMDEIKNSNMSNNLHQTQRQFAIADKITYLINMYKIEKNRHLKLGRIKTIKYICFLLCNVFVTSVKTFVKQEDLDRNIQRILIKSFVKYLREFDLKETNIFLMTDHHFYSSVIAMLYHNRNVLQHGLVLDKYFYYPIRAGRFFAWGEHSLELLERDSKVIVAGTYKFDNIANKMLLKSIRKLMFCISSLDENIVSKKIKCLYDITESLGLELIVKCHPGNLFDVRYWKNKFKDLKIIFYKEEPLSSIDFDLAISENSTINMDFVMMGKPFIIYDSAEGYFGRYFDLIPHGNCKEEIEACISHISHIDFEAINLILKKEEINSNQCDILHYV